jgi:hypothetical protein
MINTIRHDNNVTERHIDAVNHLCKLLLLEKIPFWTRLKIPNDKGGHNIPDITVFGNPLIGIEVLDSESEQKFQIKVKKAHNNLYLVKVHSVKALDIKDIYTLL